MFTGQLVTSWLHPNSISAFAVLSSYMFVMPTDSEYLEVYDISDEGLKNGHRLLCRQTITDCASVSDLAACTRNQCLYVSDTVRGTVTRLDVNISQSFQVTIRPSSMWWTAPANPKSLSVSRSTGNVIVTSPSTGTLVEYMPDGYVVRTVDVPGGTLIQAAHLCIKFYVVIVKDEDSQRCKLVVLNDLGEIQITSDHLYSSNELAQLVQIIIELFTYF